MFTGVRHIGLMLAAAGVLATSCAGGSSHPTTLPPISATPTTVADSPAAHSRHTDLAAVTAVVREYYRLLNAPTTVENAHALAALMTPDCKCRAVARATAHTARAGQEYFGRNKLTSVRVSVDSKDAADALVSYDFTPGGVRSRSGQVLRSDRGRRGASVNLRLLRAGDEWLIAAIIQIRPGTYA